MTKSKEQLFRELYESHLARDVYLDTLPDEFQVVVMDNEYSRQMWKDHYTMLEQLFGEHYESIMWFIYEWQPGYEVGFNGKSAAIHSIDGYIQWLKDNEGFK